MIQSLRLRLLVHASLAVALILALWGAGVYYFTRHSLEKDFNEALLTQARAVAATADTSLPFGGVPIGVKELDIVAGWPDTEASLVFADRVAGFTVDGSAGFARLPGLSDAQDRRYFAITIRPQVFINLVPDHVSAHRMFPLAADRTVVECDWLFDPGVVAAGHDLSRSVELFHRVNEQDFAACERCQPSMGSRGYASGGVLVPSEHHIAAFHDWLRGRLSEAAGHEIPGSLKGAAAPGHLAVGPSGGTAAPGHLAVGPSGRPAEGDPAADQEPS